MKAWLRAHPVGSAAEVGPPLPTPMLGEASSYSPHSVISAHHSVAPPMPAPLQVRHYS